MWDPYQRTIKTIDFLRNKIKCTVEKNLAYFTIRSKHTKTIVRIDWVKKLSSTWSKSLGSPLLMSQTPFLLINYCTKLFLQQSRCCILVPILLLLDLILWRILISDKKFFKSIKETSLQLLAMQFSLQIDCITFLALWCKTFSSSSNQDGRIYSR